MFTTRHALAHAQASKHLVRQQRVRKRDLIMWVWRMQTLERRCLRNRLVDVAAAAAAAAAAMCVGLARVRMWKGYGKDRMASGFRQKLSRQGAQSIAKEHSEQQPCLFHTARAARGTSMGDRRWLSAWAVSLGWEAQAWARRHVRLLAPS